MEKQKKTDEDELNENLATGYAQAMREEGISSDELKSELKAKEKPQKKI